MTSPSNLQLSKGPSKFGIWLIERINAWVPIPRNLRELHQAKLDLESYQKWEKEEAMNVVLDFLPYWSIQGKKLLDVGCGLGGKLIFYGEIGADSVDAIEIRPKSTVEASNIARRNHLARMVRPITADAARMPYPDNFFDVIVSINVFEHLDRPFETFEECRRVLNPEGKIFLFFPPFYSPWGPHLEGWINFPWPHLFFSDATLIEVAHRADSYNNNNSTYIPTAQVNWRKHERFPELNRLTAKQVFQIIEQLGFEIIESKMLPIGRHYLLGKGQLGRLVLKFLKFLARIHPIREVLTTKMVFVLGKRS
jgi:cyclopropane fatty-acyl-phospholipid synthase-like methyltransferase